MDLRKSKKMRSKKLRHPWELSRSDIILGHIRKFPKQHVFADIGAGDQFFSTKLAKLSPLQIYAIDLFYSDEGRKKIADTEIIESRKIEGIPLQDIDCFVLMDVLEHIEKDDNYIKLLSKAKPAARYLITVPAFNFLFSSHDENLGHVRRYTRGELKKVLSENGLIVKSMHYFYSSLFCLRLAGFFLEKLKFSREKETQTTRWKFGEQSVPTKFLRIFLNCDFLFNKALSMIGLHPPGLSLFAYCERTDNEG